MGEKFWPNLLPGECTDCKKWGNITIDVVNKGCFDQFDVTACVRNSFLAFLGCTTIGLCILRIVKLHVLQHPQKHQYQIFYLALAESLLLTVKWIVGINLSQLAFAATLSKMIQFIVLCHFHWTLVMRILHHKKLVARFIVPLLLVFFVFFVSITILAMCTSFSSWTECLAPHWVLLSASEFLAVQLYVVAGIYITRKINSVSALDSFKKEQKRDLWSVIAVYEFSAVVSLAYYATVQTLGTYEIGCSGIFAHTQELYSPIYVSFMIIRYLLPIWVMLLVFHPTRGRLSSEEERLLGWSVEGSVTSVFSPGVPYQRTYKPLKFPVCEGDIASSASITPVLRRSSSSPAFFTGAARHPHLTPITEEDSLIPSSRSSLWYSAVRNSHNSEPSKDISGCYGALSKHPAPLFRDLGRGGTSKIAKPRERHDSGHHPSHKGLTWRVPESVNHCRNDVESVHSSNEFA